jgi:hypothetical protein
MLTSVMLGKRVASEVSERVTPHSVDVVRTTLSVIAFHHEIRSLKSVVVRIPGSMTPGPQKAVVPEPCASVLLTFDVGQRPWKPVRIEIKQSTNHVLLASIKVAQRQAPWLLGESDSVETFRSDPCMFVRTLLNVDGQLVPRIRKATAPQLGQRDRKIVVPEGGAIRAHNVRWGNIGDDGNVALRIGQRRHQFLGQVLHAT